MVPYITILIFLIVLVLWQVYSQFESFEVTTTTAPVSTSTSSSAPMNPVMPPSPSSTSMNPVMPPSPSSISMDPLMPSPSSNYMNEVEDRIAKSVVKQIKDDLIAKYQTQMPLPATGQMNISDSISQGADMLSMKPVLSPQPDMNEYIRKDSIPCMKCNLAS